MPQLQLVDTFARVERNDIKGIAIGSRDKH